MEKTCTKCKIKKSISEFYRSNTSSDGHRTDGDWHIDHIKPCARFNLSKDSEQIKCFNFTNLQPLWSIDNLRKGKVYNEPIIT